MRPAVLSLCSLCARGSECVYSLIHGVYSFGSSLLVVSPSEHFGSGGEGGVQYGSLWGVGGLAVNLLYDSL